MKYRSILAAAFAAMALASWGWQPAGDRIKTPWAETIDVENVWGE